MNRRNQTKGFHAEQHASVLRAALYLRVSTGRQAEHDLSIPDQRAQLKSWCRTHGYSVAAEFDDRRPVFQRMIDSSVFAVYERPNTK